MEPIDSANFTAVSSRPFANFDPEQVPVWGGDIDQMIEFYPCLEGELSAEERHRSRCFQFDKHRRQFIIARGLLRVLLGHYLGKHPAKVRFAYNGYGKPSLPESRLYFNLSHSGNRLLYGFAAWQPIGVDIERVREELYDHAIAQQHFAPRETEVLRHHPADAVENFFTYWTCKEAVLKGMGRGISSLRDIDLSAMARKSYCSFSVSIGGNRAESWGVTRLHHLPGYAGAVALLGAEKRLVYREITRETLASLCRQTACR